MNFDLLLTFKLTLVWLYFGKSCKTTLFRKLTEVSRTRQHLYQLGHPLQNNGSLKIWKVFAFLAASISKKSCWHLEFLMNQIFGKRFIIFEKLRYRVNYCWNYRPSKMLLHFIEYRLDQLNSKHTKIAVNSAIQYFEGCSQKKCLLKVWSFLVHPPQNGGLVKFLRNWTETIF